MLGTRNNQYCIQAECCIRNTDLNGVDHSVWIPLHAHLLVHFDVLFMIFSCSSTHAGSSDVLCDQTVPIT